MNESEKELCRKENIAFGLFAGIMFVIGYLLLLETCLFVYLLKQ